MSLANIKGKLSRAEMKNIMAGSGDIGSCGPAPACNLSCQILCGVNNWVSGHCSYHKSTGNCSCWVVCP